MGGGKLFTFTDVITSEISTEASMRKIFNFYNYEAKNEWYTYQNLFNILKAADYYTTWISVQEYKSFGERASSIFSELCNEYKFPELVEADKSSESKNKISGDALVLLWLDEELSKVHEKNFYLLHLVGTHYYYDHRYTEPFRKFTADDEFLGKGFDSYSQRDMRAGYDNAVLYNDFIVDEIIKRFEDKNAIVIYISDHGEEIYESIDFFGHGLATRVTNNILEIPFLIWMSEKCRAENPELEQKIAASVHRPYMTDDLIHTMLDILDIETEDYDPSRSVINEKFNASRPRRFQNFIYDKEKGLVAIQ